MPFNLVKKPAFKKIRGRINKAEDDWLRALSTFMISRHQAITSNWTHSVLFKAVYFQSAGRRSVRIEVHDEIWHWLNAGTGVYGPSHQEIEIKASEGGVLRFLPEYSSKTTSASHGGSGLKTGDPVYADSVTIQGIEPRNFDETVYLLAKKEFFPRWQKVMKRAIFA